MTNLETLNIKTTTSEELGAIRMALEEDIRTARRGMSQLHFKEDGYAAYEARIAEAQRRIDQALVHQAFTFARVGKEGTDTTSTSLSAEFLMDLWLVQDHFGEKKLFDAVENMQYDDKSEYVADIAARRRAIDDICIELVDREADAKKAEADRLREAKLESIGG